MPADGNAPPARSRSTVALLLLLLVLLAAGTAVRVTLFMQFRAANPTFVEPVADSRYYDELATHLARGEPDLRDDQPFWQPPLYPWLLAGIYRATASIAGHDARFATVAAIQHLFGLASLVLVFALGRRLFGAPAGAIAALLLLLYPPLPYFETKVLACAFEVFLVLLVIWLAFRSFGVVAAESDPTSNRRFHAGWLLATGAAAGLLLLLRADKLPFVALVPPWLAFASPPPARRRLGAVALYLLPVALCMGGATLRNQVVAGDPVLIAANGGVNFWFGNQRDASGINMAPSLEWGALDTQRETARRVAELAAGRSLLDSQVASHFYGLGLEFAREHPLEWAGLLARKLRLALSDLEADIAWSWRAEAPYGPVLRALPVSFGMLLGLGVCGLLLALRAKPGPWLPALLLLSTLVILVGFFMGARFRLAAAPVLALFGGYCVTRIASFARDGGAGIASAISLALLAIAIAALSIRSAGTVRLPRDPAPLAAMLDANASVILGNAHAGLGEPRRAIEAYSRALELDSTSFKAWLGIGHMEHQRAQFLDQPRDRERRRERLAAARSALEKAVRFMPDFADCNAELGLVLLDEAAPDPAGAVAAFRAAARLEPGSIEHLLNLARALAREGSRSEAERTLDEAARRFPGDSRVAATRRGLRG